MKRGKDLLNHKFGRLYVAELVGLSKNRQKLWKCICDCGKTKIIPTSYLTSGDTSSCGCLGRPNRRKDKLYLFLKERYNAIKTRSAHKNFTGNTICFEEFCYLTQKPCFYCGSIYSNKQIANGIDRLDSSCGYTKYNCVPCCPTCNYAKGTLSLLEFYDQVRKIRLKMSSKNDDEIIARCLLSIKEGVKTGDWELVCNAYNEISGDNLTPPVPPKSRLERIREMMNVEPSEEPLANKLPKKPGRKKKEPTPASTDEVEDVEIVVKKFQGGSRFARDGFEVIEAEIDPEEQAKNLKAASKKKLLIPHKRPEKLKDTSDADPDSEGHRYYDKPKLRPPWK